MDTTHKISSDLVLAALQAVPPRRVGRLERLFYRLAALLRRG
jgi:hypothetical protein